MAKTFGELIEDVILLAKSTWDQKLEIATHLGIGI